MVFDATGIPALVSGFNWQAAIFHRLFLWRWPRGFVCPDCDYVVGILGLAIFASQAHGLQPVTINPPRFTLAGVRFSFKLVIALMPTTTDTPCKLPRYRPW